MWSVMGLRTWKQLPGKRAPFLIVHLEILQPFATCFIIFCSFLTAGQRHLKPAGAKTGKWKGVETSSNSKRLVTHRSCFEAQGTAQSPWATPATPDWLLLLERLRLWWKGPQPQGTDPSCVPEGVHRCNWLWWFYIRQGTGVTSQKGFSCPSKPASISFAVSARQLANYGNSCYEETEWNMPRVWGLGHRFPRILQPHQPNVPSPYPKWRERVSMGQARASSCAFTAYSWTSNTLYPDGFQYLPFSNKETEAQRLVAMTKSLQQARKEASKLKASTDLPHSTAYLIHQKPSYISEVPFKTLPSLKIRNSSRVKISDDSRSPRSSYWDFPTSHNLLPQDHSP